MHVRATLRNKTYAPIIEFRLNERNIFCIEINAINVDQFYRKID